MPLTDTKCRNAKPKKKPYKLADGHGLYLEVTPKGGKYWRMKYRYAAKEKRMAFGVYPEVSLAEAREARAEARKLLAQGKDPSFFKHEQKRLIALNAQNTFEAVAIEWHEHNKERWSDNHMRTVMRRLKRDVFPSIGHLPIRDITAPALLGVIRDIEKRGAHEIARRALQISGQVFMHAIITGKADKNPTKDLERALKPVKRGHYAAMEINELPDFMRKLHSNDGRLFPQTRLAMEMLLLTFVRTSELIKAKWGEFDFEDKVWVIPAERMKMRESHIVPLSEQTIAILKQLEHLNHRREYVFPSQRNPQNHMSNNAILVALKNMGYKGKHTGHGFRALAMSTIKERLDYRHEVIDRQLAHAHKNQVDAAYDRAKFLVERKEMMQKWADYLDGLAQRNNVVQGYFGKAA